MIASLGVSPNVAPALFVNFADLYKIKLPSREKKVCTGTDPATGERVYEVKDVLFISRERRIRIAAKETRAAQREAECE